MTDPTNQETSMTLKHNQHGVPPHVSNTKTEVSKFTENKQRAIQIKQEKTINSSQMEDAAWHRSKSGRFQQN